MANTNSQYLEVRNSMNQDIGEDSSLKKVNLSSALVRVVARVDYLHQLHNEWTSLCEHTVQSGFQITDLRTTDDLRRRLEMITRDVEVAIEITQHGITEEKARQKSHDIYGTADQSRELKRQLERVKEELELKQEVTEAMNRRQEKEVNMSKETNESDGRSRQPPTEPQLELNKVRHESPLRKNYNWLVDKIIAPSAAARMYQQGAITLRQFEEIRNCSNSSSQAAEKLIKVVEDQPYAVFRSFKNALKETQQDDVYMTLADIEFRANSEHIKAIRNNFVILIGNLDMKLSGTLELLYSLEVIDNLEMDAIKSTTTHSEKNEKLLSLLSRKSFGLFQKFMQALDETGQGHLADLMRSNNESKSPTLKHVIPSDGRLVAGLTFINNELFVLRHRSKEEIQVYETMTFTQQRTVRVAGLSDKSLGPWCKSLTSCDVNNCLFVSDQWNVYKVDLSTNNVINWRVDGRPIGLSVNDARHVIVTCYLGDEIREYEQTGQLIRSIKLQKSHVTAPWHAVQLNESMFIVSHWRPVHGVSLIDTRGRVTATYSKSESTKPLKYPQQLTVGKNGSVLVVDCCNNRLVVLDASLNNARELILPIDGGLDRPCCLCFNESLNHLYVGEEDGQRVIMCDNINLG